MKALILAAGKRDELFNTQFDKPICLMEIGETNLLKIQIDTLYKCGIKDIFVIRGYQKEKINIQGLKYYDNEDFNSTGILYSLFKARKEFNGELLVLYSDIYYSEAVIKKIINSKEDISVGVMMNNSDLSTEKLIPEKVKEYIFLSQKNSIENFVREKAQNIHNYPGTISQFTGIIKLSLKGCRILKKMHDFFELKNKTQNSWLVDFFREMLEFGIPITPIFIEEGWYEINSFNDYKNLLDLDFIKHKYLIKSTDWEKRSEKYNNLEWVNNDSLLNFMRESILTVNDGTKFLDVGTGTGKVMINFFNHFKKGIFFGCDINSSMMEKIKTDFQFDLKIDDAHSLVNYTNNYFDYVTARMVFHHLENPVKSAQKIHDKLKPGGKIIICEGNPPSIKSYNFYKEMFFYKEERHTFMESDLINILIRADYKNVTVKTIILKRMSLNNWLANASLPKMNVDIIKKMHFNCSDEVKEDYCMETLGDDILMDWKFSVVIGEK